jgi:hypothetical protein
MDVRSAVLGFRTRERVVHRLARLGLPAELQASETVTDADLDGLPEAAQRYLRFMGVQSRPRDRSLRARFRGQLRMKHDQRWMPFDSWQYNAVHPVARVVDMRIDVAGIVPMFGIDTYLAGRGRMYGKVLGLVTVADGTGPEFDRGELVTYLNDALLLAPSMLLGPATEWRPVDDRAFDIDLTDAGNTVTARVLVDEAGRLVDFRTEDRWYAGVDPPVRTPWTTPIDGWTALPDGRPIPAGATAVWHLPEAELAYVWGRFEPATIEFNVSPTDPW